MPDSAACHRVDAHNKYWGYVRPAARSLLALTTSALWLTGRGMGDFWTHLCTDPSYLKSTCHFIAPLPWHLSSNPWCLHAKFQRLSSKESRACYPCFSHSQEQPNSFPEVACHGEKPCPVSSSSSGAVTKQCSIAPPCLGSLRPHIPSANPPSVPAA